MGKKSRQELLKIKALSARGNSVLHPHNLLVGTTPKHITRGTSSSGYRWVRAAGSRISLPDVGPIHASHL